MSSKIKLSLLACAVGAASIATAQTSNDISPPNDVIRLPGSVTTPTMPVVVSPPRDDIGSGTAAGGVNGTSPHALPLVRSLGAAFNASDDDTMMDGAATGGAGVTPVDAKATTDGTAEAATQSINQETGSVGSGGPTDIAGVNGAGSSAGLIGGTSSAPSGGE